MIRFLLNDETVETAEAPGLLVLDWLRRRRGLSGTKEGCKEGDCGACTVLLGEASEEKVDYLPMTSCLMPLGQLQGRHLVTIEGLDLGGGKLNPVQQAIVDHGGSQCGFCTPGIVVSLTGLLTREKSGEPEHEVAKGLSGHLCRCTGYRSLKDAGAEAISAVGERGVGPLAAAGALPGYFAGIAPRLAAIQAENEAASPSGEEVVIGGGTDLYVQQGEDLPGKTVFLVPRPAKLPVVRREGEKLHVEAAATFQQLAEDPELQRVLPELGAWMDEIASWQIRNRATLGGNIVNASPIGDLSILFLGWRAELLLARGEEERVLPLADFYLGYKKKDLRPGEILREVRVAAPEGLVAGFEKVAKRRALDIATVNLAVTFRRDEEGKPREVGIAAGGVAPIPLAFKRCAALLEGSEVDLGLANHLLETAQQEIAPISDVRGSADYKRLLVRQLLIAQLTKHFPAAFTVADFYRKQVATTG
jgi:xanthine dehydrogenase small subunit